MQVFNQQLLSLLATPVYIVAIALEIALGNIRHPGSYALKDTVSNFSISILSGSINLVIKGAALGLMSFSYQFSLLQPYHGFIYWISLLLFVDIIHYGWHYLGHSCRLFWAVHVVHHSSEQFNLSVGFRAGIPEVLYKYVFFAPLALIGFEPVDIMFMYSAGEIWAVLTHTEKIRKLGWLEYILVTPSHHRVHHASNTIYLDRNIGTIFIIWDKLFGTFQAELPSPEYEPIRYGLTRPLLQNDLLHIICHEWICMWNDVRKPGLSIRQRIKYVFGPPGWSHDGSRLTSRQIKLKEGLATGSNMKNKGPELRYYQASQSTAASRA